MVIDILGAKIDVVIEASLEGGDCGESNNRERKMRINGSIPANTRVETFYHEVVHLMLAQGGYDELLEPKLEEALSQYLGMALAHFISVNDTLPTFEGLPNEQA